MNEFSHLLESQNSVIITDLLLCFSQFFPFFLQSEFFSQSSQVPHLCCKDQGSGAGGVLGSPAWGLQEVEAHEAIFLNWNFRFSNREHLFMSFVNILVFQ